jgi:hypothetical protein
VYRPERRLWLALALALLPLAAQAGQGCSEKLLTVDTYRLALGTAAKVQQRLAQLDSPVVVLGRMGQDLGKYGLRYTHAGFAHRQPDGHWRMAHLLNQCGSAEADLWYEGLGNFFLDDMFSYDSVVLIPPPAVAARLQTRLQDGPLLRTLFSSRYSMVDGRQLYTREPAQAWLQQQGYQPTELDLGPLTRLGGRMFKANIAFDDHPDALRYSNRIRTVSVDSIIHFVEGRGEGWRIEEITGTQPRRY